MNDPATTVAASGRPSRAKLLAMAMAAVTVGLLLIEALARIAMTVNTDLVQVRYTHPDPMPWSLDSPDFGWMRRPGFKGFEDNKARAFDAEGYLAIDSQRVAGRNGARVVFLGDSVTAGFGVETPESFVEVANARLAQAHAINLGVSGYSSFQGRLVFQQQVPRLRPDVVVVAFTFNDRRYALAPDSAERFRDLYERSAQRPAYRIDHALQFSYLYRELRQVLGKRDPPLVAPPLDGIAPRVNPEAYRDNLTWMAREARKANARVVFLLLGDNPLETAHLREGVRRLEQSDFPGAVVELNAAMSTGDIFSDLARVYLARAYTALGDTNTAAATMGNAKVVSVEHGGRIIRLDTEYNQIARDVAEREGAEVVDATAVLYQDPTVFTDFCHFNAKGHRLVGELLADRLAQLIVRKGH